jgi:hypothetical protein
MNLAMPTKDQHVQKASDNEALAAKLDTASQASLNWKLIIMFYVAVHYVEAYLAKSMSIHLRSHTTRDSYISREANLRKIRTEYGHLKFYGYNARYEVDQFTANDVTDAFAYLANVKNAILPLL